MSAIYVIWKRRHPFFLSASPQNSYFSTITSGMMSIYLTNVVGYTQVFKRYVDRLSLYLLALYFNVIFLCYQVCSPQYFQT